MDNTALCRVCFADNDKMRKLSKPLQKLYEKLTDAKLSSKDRRTSIFCSMCYTHLQRCYSFQRAATRAEHLLRQLNLNGTKTEGTISMVKRSSIHNYSCSPIQYVNIYNETERDSNNIYRDKHTVRNRDGHNSNTSISISECDSIPICSDVKEERDSDIKEDDGQERDSDIGDGRDSVKSVSSNEGAEIEEEELGEKDGYIKRRSRKRVSEKEEEEELLREQKKKVFKSPIESENQNAIQISGAREKSESRSPVHSCRQDNADEAVREDPFAEVLTFDNEVLVHEHSEDETDSQQTVTKKQMARNKTPKTAEEIRKQKRECERIVSRVIFPPLWGEDRISSKISSLLSLGAGGNYPQGTYEGTIEDFETGLGFNSGRRSTSVRQLETMITYMEGHREFGLSRVRSLEARATSAKSWDTLTEALNKDGPHSRSAKEWSKVWNDYKCRVRQKVSKINKARRGARSGSDTKLPLSPFERRVADIMRQT